jgi:hypothetical protein
MTAYSERFLRFENFSQVRFGTARYKNAYGKLVGLARSDEELKDFLLNFVVFAFIKPVHDHHKNTPRSRGLPERLNQQLLELHRPGATDYQFILFHTFLQRHEKFRSRCSQLISNGRDETVPRSAFRMSTPEEKRSPKSAFVVALPGKHLSNFRLADSG